ncbi:MAG: hypothetical protein LAN71_11430 [Acidobacteriia bacterium]|nr:hypothetical protein [Terriglobia bacterium]
MALAFFRNGWSELKRKLERRRWKGQLRKQQEEMTKAQWQLGEQAWKQQMDLSPFPELRQQLTQMDRDAGELDSASKNLQAEEQRLTAQRGAETAKFDAQRKAVEEKKRPVDESLRAARARQDGLEQTVRRLEARRAALGAELAALDKPAPAGAAPDPQQAGKRAQLLAEQEQLPGQISAAQAGLPAALAETQRLTQENLGYAAELTRIEQERSAAVAPLDEQLKVVASRMQNVRNATGAIEKNRTERFTQLGAALFAMKSSDPSIGEPMRAALAIAQRQAATQEALTASLALSQTMPSGTMLKFASALILTPLLAVGLAAGSYWFWHSRPYPELSDPIQETNPYLSHSLRSLPPYILANQLANAHGEEGTARLLLDVFRAIHLGVYKPNGEKILAGSEHSDKDFFLYDFQWKILAHAYHNHNIVSFSDQSMVFGKALLDMKDPAKLDPILAESVYRRYHEALEKPDDPMSFLILLVDGLARHQIRPYSLDEIKTKPHDQIYLDPIQTWLLTLDFLIGPQQKSAAHASRGFFSLPWPQLTSVYASGGCEDIVGDDTKEAWGRGTDIAGDVAEKAGEELEKHALEKAGAVAGKTLGVVQAAGDLLFLYGVNIKVTPQPSHIHLLNPEMPNFLAGIEATVTFDSQGVPDEVLKCGWLAGKKMPLNGPVKNVELWWDFSPYLSPDFEAATDIMWHGDNPTITNVAGGYRTRTDENGKSIFLIRPIRACPRHPKGMTIEGNRYMAIVSVKFVTSDMPTPGLADTIGLVLKFGPGAIEYLMRGRKGYGNFWSEWHKKRPKRYNEEQ